VTTAYSAHCPDSVTAALGIHLAIYCAVGACFTFGLYALLQPARSPNSGLAEYKPPPGAVVTYAKPSVVAKIAEPIAPMEQDIAPIVPIDPKPATMGHSTPELELKQPTATTPSRPRTAKRPHREVKIDSAKPRNAACIPGYDSSGAQTRPCG
jgi:hypothetical protein